MPLIKKGMPDDLLDIFAAPPQDQQAGERKQAEIDPDDFKEDPKTDENESSEEPNVNNDGNSNADSAAGNVDSGASEEVETEEGSEESGEEDKPKLTEKQQKIQDAKKEVVQSLIEPATIVAFSDMLLSRVGSMVPNSERSDWELDQEEKEILAKLLDAMVEEDGIEFWPAHTWLLIAVVFIYGVKGFTVWENGENEQTAEEQKLQGELEIAKLELLRDTEKRKAELKDEIAGFKSINIDPEPAASNGTDAEEDRFVYESDGVTHVCNSDGSWKKKPGPGKGSNGIADAEVVEETDNKKEDGAE